jgi:hypothetical protein
MGIGIAGKGCKMTYSHTLKGRVSSVGEQNRKVYKGIIPY